MPYFVYIVQGSDKSYYTGYTNNLVSRVNIHNKKNGAKALKGKLPVHLVYSETFETKSEALKREAGIKSLTREKKIQLIMRG